tara:strand:+ start:16962 stop:17423 length:462 start_codon:yes stop_codon:yes gene_type:complete
MTKMTIAKALRYKKRVVSRISKLEADIVANNSVVEGGEREINVSAALAQRGDTVSHLITVKLAISSASAPIQRMILECAESKSQIAFLSRVPVQHGLQSDRWQEQTTTYEAELRKAERDAKVLELEDRIDELQSQIDSFNNANHVEFTDLIGK